MKKSKQVDVYQSDTDETKRPHTTAKITQEIFYEYTDDHDRHV